MSITRRDMLKGTLAAALAPLAGAESACCVGATPSSVDLGPVTSCPAGPATFAIGAGMHFAVRVRVYACPGDDACQDPYRKVIWPLGMPASESGEWPIAFDDKGCPLIPESWHAIVPTVCDPPHPVPVSAAKLNALPAGDVQLVVMDDATWEVVAQVAAYTPEEAEPHRYWDGTQKA